MIIHILECLVIGDSANTNRLVNRYLIAETNQRERLLLVVAPCWAHNLSNCTRWSLSRFPFCDILRLVNVVFRPGLFLLKLVGLSNIFANGPFSATWFHMRFPHCVTLGCYFQPAQSSVSLHHMYKMFCPGAHIVLQEKPLSREVLWNHCKEKRRGLRTLLPILSPIFGVNYNFSPNG